MFEIEKKVEKTLLEMIDDLRAGKYDVQDFKNRLELLEAMLHTAELLGKVEASVRCSPSPVITPWHEGSYTTARSLSDAELTGLKIKI